MKSPYLSVIIPAYREAERIQPTLSVIGSFLRRSPWTFEVIVVDDGSPDRTVDVVREFAATQKDFPLVLLQHGQNKGKGAAVRTGMLHAKGTYALFADADNATPFSEIVKLLKRAEKGSDIVIGSRYVAGSNIQKKQTILRRLMSRAGNLLFRVVLGLSLHDTRCGFKLFTEKARETVFPRQTLQRWGFDTEVLLIGKLHGLEVAEVPVIWYDRERSTIHPIRDSFRSFGELIHMVRMLLLGRYR